MTKKFFVYGTLLEGFINYEKYLKGKIIIREYARTKGELYHLVDCGYPAMVDGSDYVYGELIDFEDYANTVKEIDEMEHYFGKNNANNEYNRLEIEVEPLEGGKHETAYAYIYNLKNVEELRSKDIYIKDGDWKKFCSEHNAKYKILAG